MKVALGSADLGSVVVLPDATVTVTFPNGKKALYLFELERRKQAGADGGSNANRKLFGIQLPNSKPKP